MSEILKSYYDFVQLSQAAYATLTPNIGGQPYRDALTSIDAEFSTTQASDFSDRYQVLHQQTIGGFSATLFEVLSDQGQPTGEKVLAIRGTDGFLDSLSDLNILFGTGGIFDGQYDKLKEYYEQLIAPAGQELSGGRVGLGLLGAGEQIKVTGHSLGGYLAQTFTADPMFSSKVLHAYTYNAPGYNGIWAEIAELVGFSPASTPNSKITNLFAENGLSATSGLGTLVGAVQNIFIEEGSPLHNHTIVTLTDSLALYNLIGMIDPQIDISRLTGILNATGTTGGSSLEQTLYALRSLFQTPPNSLTLNTPLEADERDAYYLNIETLTTFLSGVPPGTFTVESLVNQPVGTVAALAELPPVELNPLAYRYALTQLNPFVIHGADYDRHNTTGELELVNLTAGIGALTHDYLFDRALFLSNKIAANLSDSSTIGGATHFQDLATGYELNPSIVVPSFVRDHVIFGADVAETIAGGDRDDQLYGGDGVDMLLGNAGIDYLQGDAGNDTLDGGSGADRMVGGQGNDTYIVDNAGDSVTEGLNNGSDTVQSSVSFTLGANVEDLTLTGTNDINGTGNELDNLITGNDGINRLDGKGGTDHLIGGIGNDILVGGTGDNDLLEGGAGFDTDIYNAGDGTDRVEENALQLALTQ